MRYDAENLYLGLTAPQVKALAASRAEDSDVSDDAAIMTFMFDTNFDRWSFFSLHLDCRGGLDCHYAPVPWVPKGPMDVAACKAAVSEDDGTAEVSIPLSLFSYRWPAGKALKSPVAEGSVWGANFVMIDPTSGSEMSWAPLSGRTDGEPDRFNAIRFVGKASKEE